jgi:hypothetical protein
MICIYQDVPLVSVQDIVTIEKGRLCGLLVRLPDW